MTGTPATDSGLEVLLIFLAVGVLFLPLIVYLIHPPFVWTRLLQFHPLTRVVRLLPRALDAWVWANESKANRIFFSRDYLSEYLPVAIRLDGSPMESLKAADLQRVFENDGTVILIWGDSGSGKTRLAYELARVADSKYASLRPAKRHPMLPLLIEDDPFAGEQPVASWREVLVANLTALTGPEPQSGLYLQLLQQKRVLVIIDGLSEMAAGARSRLEHEAATLPAKALILTSRLREPLRRLQSTEIETGPIPSDRLALSMDAYLGSRGQRGLFPDEEYLESVPRLARLAAPSPVTMGLLKIYCEAMVAIKRMSPPREFPRNIVELMEEYRDTELEGNASAIESANAAAWLCVGPSLRPGPITDDVPGIGPLVWRSESGKLRFAIPLLAEYLAAIFLAEQYRSNEGAWRSFLALARSKDGAPTSIRSFLNALRDVVAARAEQLGIPDAILLEMAPLLGDALLRIRQEIRSRRVDVLVRDLSND